LKREIINSTSFPLYFSLKSLRFYVRFEVFTVFLRSVSRLLVAGCIVPSSPIFVTLMKEAPGSSETSVLTRATWRNNPKDTILPEVLVLISTETSILLCIFLVSPGKCWAIILKREIMTSTLLFTYILQVQHWIRSSN
jgi:hypothetical protein